MRVKPPRIYCKALQVREEKANFALLVKKAGRQTFRALILEKRLWKPERA